MSRAFLSEVSFFGFLLGGALELSLLLPWRQTMLLGEVLGVLGGRVGPLIGLLGLGVGGLGADDDESELALVNPLYLALCCLRRT